MGTGNPEVVKDRVDVGDSQTGERSFQMAEIGEDEPERELLGFDQVSSFTKNAFAGGFEVRRIAVKSYEGASRRKISDDFGGMPPETERGVDYRDGAVFL
jgi:hypothetical protein